MHYYRKIAHVVLLINFETNKFLTMSGNKNKQWILTMSFSYGNIYIKILREFSL